MNPLCWNIEIYRVTSQIVHIKFSNINNLLLHITFVYSKNEMVIHIEAWAGICYLRNDVRDDRWMVVGGFNEVLISSERLRQATFSIEGSEDFKNVIEYRRLQELKVIGPLYTWYRGSSNAYKASRIHTLLNKNGKDTWLAMQVRLLHGASDHLSQLVTFTHVVS